MRALAALVGGLLATATANAEPPRVAAARSAKLTHVQEMFAAAHVPWPARAVLLRAFKKERVLELWAGDGKAPLALVHSYAICASSGVLGPKRMQGDNQVPEGFYTVDSLNPASRFHLALHVDYPNAADKARGRRAHVADLGGEIMVHGNCVTIGCIPIEDDNIDEVYLAVADARAAGVKILIELFPARLDDAGLAALLATEQDDDTKALWRELAAGYRAFEGSHRPPGIRINAEGRYVVTPTP